MTAVQTFDGGASAAAVQQQLNDAIAHYGRIADELAAYSGRT